MSTAVKPRCYCGLGWGHCGIESLKYKNDIVVPIPKNEELFIRVKGTGINTIIER